MTAAAIARTTARAVTPNELAPAAADLLAEGYRLALAAAHDDDDGTLRLVYVFTAGAPDRRVELVVRVPVGEPRVPSLATLSFPAGRFEREMHDLYGVDPVGHPLPRRLVRHGHWPAGWYPGRHDAAVAPAFLDVAEPYPFVSVEGAGVYEIPVGPVHAGLIEPGHFRFSVVGENIIKVKARLWFVHRGIERLFEGRDARTGAALAERISGDTSAAHALAYTLAVEDALGIEVPDEVQRLRALVVELERLYNHVADIGAMANDVGYGIANAFALRLRERLLRMNATVTGHRLLRGAVHPGGVMLARLPSSAELESAATWLAEIADLALAHGVVRERFTGTATLSTEAARDLGCLGYVARASGLDVDARVEHPYTPLPVQPSVRAGGDVLARFAVRRDEVEAAGAIATQIVGGHAGPLSWSSAARRRRRAGVRAGLGIVEGWRGTVVHRVEVDGDGRLRRVKVVDPSWFNWPALPVALADSIVPDFPLANKSFNCSYAGNDL